MLSSGKKNALIDGKKTDSYSTSLVYLDLIVPVDIKKATKMMETAKLKGKFPAHLSRIPQMVFIFYYITF